MNKFKKSMTVGTYFVTNEYVCHFIISKPYGLTGLNMAKYKVQKADIFPNGKIIE
jgi:hypothetical protein